MDGNDSNNNDSNELPPDFVERYFRRLKLDPTTLDTQPTATKLAQIHEQHLAEIPFENLSQHGLPYPATLNVNKTAHKVLYQDRGGFCYELNTLLALFLKALGYKVQLVPARVCDPLEDIFLGPTHVILIVTTTDANEAFYADVGLGEPPLHPLAYGPAWWNVPQVTPEGMHSKLQLHDESNEIVLYWKIKMPINNDQKPSINSANDYNNTTWEARVRWDYGYLTQHPEGANDADLAIGLERVTSPQSIFSQKVVVTRCTRTLKQTLAGGGSRLKTTGPPRFSSSTGIAAASCVSNRPMTSRDETCQVLQDVFGISRQATESSLNLEASLQAADAIFDAY